MPTEFTLVTVRVTKSMQIFRPNQLYLQDFRQSLTPNLGLILHEKISFMAR